MIQVSHILALSQQSFVRRQVTRLFAAERDSRRDSFRRSWGFDEL